jgi:hypothetical protein
MWRAVLTVGLAAAVTTALPQCAAAQAVIQAPHDAEIEAGVRPGRGPTIVLDGVESAGQLLSGATPLRRAVPTVAGRIYIGGPLSIRGSLDLVPASRFSLGFDPSRAAPPGASVYTKSIDVRASYKAISLVPSIDLGSNALFRPWIGAGVGLRWIGREETHALARRGSDEAAGTYKYTQGWRETSVLVSGGIRVALAPHTFIGASADWRPLRVQADGDGPAPQRSPRLTGGIAVGILF